MNQSESKENTPSETYIISYEDKLGMMLLDLKPYEPFIIRDKVDPANKERFMSEVKSYIDRRFGHREGFEIMFSCDYTTLRKETLNQTK